MDTKKGDEQNSDFFGGISTRHDLAIEKCRNATAQTTTMVITLSTS